MARVTGTGWCAEPSAGRRFALAFGVCPMLETARTGACAGSLQECSSIGRAPVSKTGGRRFEPCHSCHNIKDLQVYAVKLEPQIHSQIHNSEGRLETQKPGTMAGLCGD